MFVHYGKLLSTVLLLASSSFALAKFAGQARVTKMRVIEKYDGVASELGALHLALGGRAGILEFDFGYVIADIDSDVERNKLRYQNVVDNENDIVERFDVRLVRRDDGSYETRLPEEDGTWGRGTLLDGSLVYDGDGGAVLQWTELDGAKIKIEIEGVLVPDKNEKLNEEEWKLSIRGEKIYPDGNTIVKFEDELEFLGLPRGITFR